MKTLTKICKNCKKEFTIEFFQRCQRYCSQECYWSYKKGKTYEDIGRFPMAEETKKMISHALSKKIRKVCKFCGVEFYVKPFNRDIAKYCSRVCTDKGRNVRVKKVCNVCGQYFEVSNNRKEMSKYCSRECLGKDYSEKKAGEGNPMWNGGSSFVPYPTEWTDILRESIRGRDNYVCQICGVHQNEEGHRLHCHHIDYNKENLNPKNLVSLCRNCHSKTNFDREYWTSYFLKQI